MAFSGIKSKVCKHEGCNQQAQSYGNYCGQHSDNENYDELLGKALKKHKLAHTFYIYDEKITDINIDGVNFIKSYISTVLFENVKFTKCNFIESTLESINFEGCIFEDCSFENIFCLDLTFSDCNINNFNIINSRMLKTLFYGSEQDKSVLFNLQISGSLLFDFSIQHALSPKLNIINCKVNQFIVNSSNIDSSSFKNINYDVFVISNSSFRNSSVVDLTSVTNEVVLEMNDCYNTEITETEISDKKHIWNNFTHENIVFFYIDLLNYLLEKKDIDDLDEVFIALEKLFEYKQIKHEYLINTHSILLDFRYKFQDDISVSRELYGYALRLSALANEANLFFRLDNPIKAIEAPLNYKQNKMARLKIVYEMDHLYFDEVSRLFELEKDFFEILLRIDNNKQEIVSLEKGSLSKEIFSTAKQLLVAGVFLDEEKLVLENQGLEITNEILIELANNLPEKERLDILEKVEILKTEKLKQQVLKQSIKHKEELHTLETENKKLELLEKRLKIKALLKQIDPDYDLDVFIDSVDGKLLQNKADELNSEFKIKQLSAQVALKYKYNQMTGQ